MTADFHIFPSGDDTEFTIRQVGLSGERVFPSLGAATRHLRDFTKGSTGFVVIHDETDDSTNRIPLQPLPLTDV